MKYTFVVEGKTFNVDIQHKKINEETKYVLVLCKVRKNEEGNAEATYISKLINLSSEKDVPECWNSESACFNWTHNWVEHNIKRL